MSTLKQPSKFDLRRKLMLLMAIPLAAVLLLTAIPETKQFKEKATMHLSLIYVGLTQAKHLGAIAIARTINE